MLDGTALAETRRLILAERVRQYAAATGRQPGLAVVLVGDDPASHLYVRLKEKAAREVGVDFHKYLLPESATQEEVLSVVRFLREDDAVDGMIVQMPLPSHLDADAVVDAIGHAKDADGFHKDSLAAFARDADALWPVFPRALMTLVEAAGVDLTGRRAALVVNSELLGATLAVACARLGLDAQVVLRDRLACMQAATLAADVLITACGVPGLITADYIKPAAIVVDGGIARNAEGHTVGDVDAAGAAARAAYLSPVPGGVGPLTIACLLENVVTLAERCSAATDSK